MKVLHVITGLGRGGAEAVLCRLVAGSREVQHVVVSLMDEGVHGEDLRNSGVALITLNMRRGRVALGALMRLRRVVLDTRPDVVQTWLYHADLIGGLVARAAGARPVVWGIRNCYLDPRCSVSTRLAVRACASLSSWLPAAIACCSERAAVVHKARGYRAARFEVIPNGYGLGQFFPDAIAGAQVRAQWGIEPNEPLIGMVARWDAQKRHANLLAALAMLRDRVPKCALIGPGMESSNLELMRLIRSRELGTRVVLAGTRNDIPAVMNALDVHVLPSASEAFPNVVGEAMACGTPCVVTDVGDAALIVGETGWVVPPDNIPALARGIHRALTSIRLNGKQNLGTICRKRIETHFSLARMVASYTALWAKVVTRARPGPFAISDQEA